MSSNNLKLSVCVFFSILLVGSFVSAANFNVKNVSGSNSYLFVNGTSGNVGIGATSPDAKLTVQGEINLTSSSVRIFSEGGALVVSGKF